MAEVVIVRKRHPTYQRCARSQCRRPVAWIIGGCMHQANPGPVRVRGDDVFLTGRCAACGERYEVNTRGLPERVRERAKAAA